MSKIIVALDFPTKAKALDLVEKVGTGPLYKVGMELFNAEGPDFVKSLTEKGLKVFLDLKFHDIPNTVAGAARSAVRTGCFMFNVHALGGKKMMHAAVEAAREEAEKLKCSVPKLIAVTVLTSMSENDLRELHITHEVKDYVAHLAKQAQEAGLDGVVASPHEIDIIRKTCGKDFMIVTPGVRPTWAATNDQKRIMTPGDAIKKGADFVVIGRPITAHEQPQQAYKLVVEETEEV